MGLGCYLLTSRLERIFQSCSVPQIFRHFVGQLVPGPQSASMPTQTPYYHHEIHKMILLLRNSVFEGVRNFLTPVNVSNFAAKEIFETKSIKE
jgi:hypothetical protein